MKRCLTLRVRQMQIKTTSYLLLYSTSYNLSAITHAWEEGWGQLEVCHVAGGWSGSSAVLL